jgi:hypothetical protein
MDRGLPVLLEDLGARKVAKAVRLKFVDIGSLALAAARNLPLAGGDLRYLPPPWRSASGHFRPARRPDGPWVPFGRDRPPGRLYRRREAGYRPLGLEAGVSGISRQRE